MSEQELLRSLDRRARSAADALDASVGEIDIPERTADRDAPRLARWTPLLVAAGVLVVALVGAAVLLSSDDERSVSGVADEDPTVETRDGPTRLGLAEPAALGFEVSAAFDLSTADAGDPPAGTTGMDMEMVVQGPTDADDPWASAVVTYDTPLDPYQLQGVVVDVGGPEAVATAIAGMERVAVRDGNTIHTLSSVRLGRGELVDLATEAVDGGWDPLPGHDVLHRGPAYSVTPNLAFAALQPAESIMAGIAYSHPDDQDFVVAWTAGTENAWRASFSLADTVKMTTVRGRPAAVVSNEMLTGTTELTTVSWLEGDDTIVQVATAGDVRRLLATIEAELRPIDAGSFSRLVARHPASDDQMLLPLDDSAPPFDDGTALASVGAGMGTRTFRVELQEANGGYMLMMTIEEENGSSGSGGPIIDLQTTWMSRSSVSSTTSSNNGGGGSPPAAENFSEVVIGGLVGPGLNDIEITDASTGATVPLLASASTAVEGTDHILFVAAVDSSLKDTRLIVVATTDEGVVRYRL